MDQEWTASELSEILPMDNPAISRVVSKLVDKGILKRRRPREDRRIVLLKLTEDGVSLGLKLHDKLHSYEAKLVKGVPEGEIEALRSTIKKVLHNRNALEQPKDQQLSTSASKAHNANCNGHLRKRPPITSMTT